MAAGDNFIQIVGNLTNDPDLRETPSGAMLVAFGLAQNDVWVDPSGERREHTNFFNVSAWDAQAPNIADSLKKGDRVVVTGRIKYRTWQADDGTKRSAHEIRAHVVAPSLQWATVEDVTRNAKSTDAAPHPAAEELADAEPF